MCQKRKRTRWTKSKENREIGGGSRREFEKDINKHTYKTETRHTCPRKDGAVRAGRHLLCTNWFISGRTHPRRGQTRSALRLLSGHHVEDSRGEEDSGRMAWNNGHIKGCRGSGM